MYKHIYFNKNIFKIYKMRFNFRGLETWCKDTGCMILGFWTCWNSACACIAILPILAYPMNLRVLLQALFIDARLTAAMNSYRYKWVVFGCQWSGHFVRSFTFLDFKSNLQLGLGGVVKMYMVCSIMQNALSCTYGNQTSEYFGWDPPTIQEYLS